MSMRIVWVGEAPTLAEAQGQASDVNSTQTLFGNSVTSTTAAAAATVLGTHYLLVMGPEFNIENALSGIPEDWHSTRAESREGDDAGPSSWIPSWAIAAYLLAKI